MFILESSVVQILAAGAGKTENDLLLPDVTKEEDLPRDTLSKPKALQTEQQSPQRAEASNQLGRELHRPEKHRTMLWTLEWTFFISRP